MAKRSYEKRAETYVSNREAIAALEENSRTINDPIDRNLNLALIYLVRAVDRLSIDLDLLQTYVRKPGAL